MTEEKKKNPKKAAPPKPGAVPRKRKMAPPVEASAVAAKVEAPKRAPKRALPAAPRYFGTGRRKEAVAKVWLGAGTGKILLNNRPFSDYFCQRKLLEFQVNQPLAVTQTAGRFDVYAQVFGGGVPAQAGAVALGIARALVQSNAEFKALLKKKGLLTRDPRMKERKKYGLKRARRAFQYTKR